MNSANDHGVLLKNADEHPQSGSAAIDDDSIPSSSSTPPLLLPGAARSWFVRNVRTGNVSGYNDKNLELHGACANPTTTSPW